MSSRSNVRRICCLVASVSLATQVVCTGLQAHAQTDKFQILHSFDCSAEGCSPSSLLSLGRHGELYGTTTEGGDSVYPCPSYGCGTVFGLARSSDPPYSWMMLTLHRFTAVGEGGDPPGGVTLDKSGNMFGSTEYGPDRYTGTVFELAPGSAAGNFWSSADLYNFNAYGGGEDGNQPESRVTLDSHGAIYGTTRQATEYAGIVYKVAPSSSGWTETILYGFCAQPPCTDGAEPQSDVIFDRDGNLYGATPFGGSGYGVVYELTPTESGQWTEKALWTFSGGADGAYSGQDLIFDRQGSLYSTTTGGGPCDDGTVFKLTTDGDGTWSESVLYGFPDAQNGGAPFSGLTFDAAGNIYGVAKGGIENCTSGCGVVYRLHPEGNGQWSYTVLHKFAGSPTDGAWPFAGVTPDGEGNLFGTTAFGGQYNTGTVYEISP